VCGAIANGKRAQVRYPWAEYQPQDRFEELNEREGVEEQRLLEGDSGVASIKIFAEDLTNKQG